MAENTRTNRVAVGSSASRSSDTKLETFEVSKHTINKLYSLDELSKNKQIIDLEIWSSYSNYKGIEKFGFNTSAIKQLYLDRLQSVFSDGIVSITNPNFDYKLKSNLQLQHGKHGNFTWNIKGIKSIITDFTNKSEHTERLIENIDPSEITALATGTWYAFSSAGSKQRLFLVTNNTYGEYGDIKNGIVNVKQFLEKTFWAGSSLVDVFIQKGSEDELISEFMDFYLSGGPHSKDNSFLVMDDPEKYFYATTWRGSFLEPRDERHDLEIQRLTTAILEKDDTSISVLAFLAGFPISKDLTRHVGSFKCKVLRNFLFVEIKGKYTGSAWKIESFSNNKEIFSISYDRKTSVDNTLTRYITGYTAKSIGQIDFDELKDIVVDSDEKISEEEDSINFINSFDSEELKLHMMNILSQVPLDSVMHSDQESMARIANKVLSFDIRNGQLPRFSNDDLNFLRGKLPDLDFNKFEMINTVNDMAISKSIDNVVTILEAFQSEFRDIMNFQFKDPNDALKLAEKAISVVNNFNSAFDELDHEQDYSNFENLTANRRNELRPRFERNFDDFELNLQIFFKKLKSWVFWRAGSIEKIEKVEKIIETLSLGNVIKYSFDSVKSILATLVKIIGKASSMVLRSLANGLAVVDDVYDYIIKTRLPISVNRNIKWDTSWKHYIVDLTDASKPKISDNGIKRGFWVQDFSGLQFGDDKWDIDTGLPVFTHPMFSYGSVKPKNLFLWDYQNVDGNKIYSGNPNDDLNGNNLIPGWFFSINPLYSDEWNKFAKDLSKSAKKFPYLAYAGFFNVHIDNFDPRVTASEKGYGALAIFGQLSIAVLTAVAKAPDPISKLIAAIIAAAAVSAVNIAAAVEWFNQFDVKSPRNRSRLLSRHYKKRKTNNLANFDTYYYHLLPINIFLFAPWSRNKWAIQQGLFLAKLSIAFIGAAAVGAGAASAATKIRTAIRKHNARKPYRKKVLVDDCTEVNGERICKYDRHGKIKKRKVPNENRYQTLPDGTKVKLTKKELDEKIAFETYINMSSSKSAGKLPSIPDINLPNVENESKEIKKLNPTLANIATEAASTGLILSVIDKRTKTLLEGENFRKYRLGLPGAEFKEE